MPNKNLLTHQSRVAALEQAYFAPSAVVPPEINIPLGTSYIVIGSVDTWADDNNPPSPAQNQIAMKKFMKNIIAAKLINSSDISPVAQRIDWTTGTVYDYFDDYVDMFERDANGFLLKHFYVKNKYDQIFKCLWNDCGNPAYSEPYFEPGSYSTNGIYQGADAYKWKYMYTIDTGLKTKFMDATWIPVPVNNTNPNPLITGAGAGSIDVINVIQNGDLYDPANSVIQIVIRGDGTGANGLPYTTASAVASVSSGKITDIILTDIGKNYTYANVSIISNSGFGALAVAPTSPIGGHGFDPVSELGCNHLMYNVEFNGSENYTVPTDIIYHQIGVVVNATTQALNPYPANGTIYKTTTDVVVASGFGAYTNGEFVYQGTNYDDGYFRGTVVSFDEASNVLNLINTKGTAKLNDPLKSTSSSTTRTLLSTTPPDFVMLSGYLSYMENRSGIIRSSEGIEQIKIVLGY
jgi:hypothetical protein